MIKSQIFPRRLKLALAFSALLAACSSVTEPPAVCPVCPPCPGQPTVETQPPAKPLQQATWSDLPGWNEDDPAAAWPGFLQSCRGMAGKPYWPLWSAVCEEAKSVPAKDGKAIRSFFETRMEPFLMTNADGSTSGMITGYYEPLLRGSRRQTTQYSQPVLGVPSDLLTIDLSEVAPELKNMRLRGRLQGNKVVPYYSRAEIIGKELEKSSPEKVLLWVDDAVELFFLQIQGSGRIKLPDGNMVRLGYADQNGHPYKAIGRVLADRGELPIEQASMQGIQAWARANPDKLNDILNTNPSYVFFREMPGKGNSQEGPLGALGLPLTPERSIAVDPRNIPLGAPVFLATTRPNSTEPLNRLMLAQDTGGAIRGVVRADFFWGFGASAGAQAGRMKQQGKMWVLLPKGYRHL